MIDYEKVYDDGISKAVKYAKEAHKGQMYGKNPYFFHLLKTLRVLRSYPHIHHTTKNNMELCQAAILHDIFEDTKADNSAFIDAFGYIVFGIVSGVTENQAVKSRADRHKYAYETISGDANCIVTKLCDRIANILYSCETRDSKFLKMYDKEHSEFLWYLFDEEQYRYNSMVQHFWDVYFYIIDHSDKYLGVPFNVALLSLSKEIEECTPEPSCRG